MNPLHTEMLARDRIAQVRRDTRTYTATPEPKPLPPLRWPLLWAFRLVGIRRESAHHGSIR
jgi:hypothetical protein